MQKDRSNREPLILFLDPTHYTPQYTIPLTRHLRAFGVSVDRGWQRPLHGDSEPPEFEFFRWTFRFRHWLWATSRLMWRIARGLEYLYDTFRLRRFIKKRGYSTIHYNLLVFPALDFLFIRWLKKQRVSVVITVHNAKPLDGGKSSKYVARAYRQADHLVTLTNHVKKMVTSGAGIVADRITVIPHGDQSGYMPTAPRIDENILPEWFPLNSPLAVCLGNICDYKGVPDLLLAWPKVIQAIPDARLIIAGQLRESGRKEVLSRLKDLGEVASTVFTEFRFLSCDKYESYLRAATVLVQPYRFASQSGNTVHAYSCGVPVVCTRVAGLPEMVEEGVTGAVAETENVESLADGIIRVLKANSKGEMRAKCLHVAQTRYSWQNIGASVTDVYRKAMLQT